MTLSERERRLAKLARIIADRDNLARLLATESARVAELTAKLDRVRALPVGPPSGGYFMVSMREVREALDADGGDHA